MDWHGWLCADLEELQAVLAQVQGAEVEGLSDLILGSRRTFVVGQGRSGLLMRMFALRLMQLGLTVHVVGDVTTPAIGAGDLLVACSGSGETAGVLTPARRAKQLGAKVAAVVAQSGSSLSRLADHTLLVPGETPKVSMAQRSKLPLATVLEQAMLVVLDCVIARLGERLGQTNEHMMTRHANLE
ncbi:MAG: 6-phospho-3-hexuloisomerase [Anaerolineae bacterium]